VVLVGRGYSLVIAPLICPDRGDAPASYGRSATCRCAGHLSGWRRTQTPEQTPQAQLIRRGMTCPVFDEKIHRPSFPILGRATTVPLNDRPLQKTLSLPTCLGYSSVSGVHETCTFGGILNQSGTFDTSEHIAIDYRAWWRRARTVLFNTRISLNIPGTWQISPAAFYPCTHPLVPTSSAVAADPFDGLEILNGEVEDYKSRSRRGLCLLAATGCSTRVTQANSQLHRLSFAELGGAWYSITATDIGTPAGRSNMRVAWGV